VTVVGSTAIYGKALLKKMKKKKNLILTLLLCPVTTFLSARESNKNVNNKIDTSLKRRLLFCVICQTV
jgi:hypothetical protein